MKKQLHNIAKNLFLGDHSTTIVIGFTVGGALLGRSLWQYFYDTVGLLYTALIGLFIFVASGFYMHNFYDEVDNDTYTKNKL